MPKTETAESYRNAWQYPVRINAENEKRLINEKIATKESYNEIINKALDAYFTKTKK
jgi:hypothetical protein